MLQDHVVQFVKSMFQLQHFIQGCSTFILIPSSKQFLISVKLSVNKLNPWEAAALTNTQLLLHVSSQWGL